MKTKAHLLLPLKLTLRFDGLSVLSLSKGAASLTPPSMIDS
jgi:hypothetical protein